MAKCKALTGSAMKGLTVTHLSVPKVYTHTTLKNLVMTNCYRWRCKLAITKQCANKDVVHRNITDSCTNQPALSRGYM